MHILQYILCLTPISVHNEPPDIMKLKQQKFKTPVFDGILEQCVYINVHLHPYPELNAI
jgi:hypothetical protein